MTDTPTSSRTRSDEPDQGPTQGPDQDRDLGHDQDAKFYRDPGSMSLGDHIEDLRRRLILAVGGVLPIVLLAFIFGQPLVELLIHPVQDALRGAGLNPTLQSTGVFEMFGAYVRVSIIAAILVGSPWLLYQLWRFVAPGLYDNERRFVYFLIPLSVTLSIMGVLFLYTVILPVVLAFFIQFGASVGDPSTPTLALPDGVDLGQMVALAGDPPNPQPGSWWINTDLRQLRVAVPAGSDPKAGVMILGSPLTESAGVVPQYRISEYVKSLLSMALAFGGGFQMPVVILLLGWAGIVEPKWLSKYRRHAFLGCCLASAILTPADPLSMVLLAIPLYLLYEFGIVLLRFMPPARIARGFWRGGPVKTATTTSDPDAGSEWNPDDDPGTPPTNPGTNPSTSPSTGPGAGTPSTTGPAGGRSRFDYFDVDTEVDADVDVTDDRPTDAYGEYTDTDPYTDRKTDEGRGGRPTRPPTRPGDEPWP